jgi:hypothetical protein
MAGVGVDGPVSIALGRAALTRAPGHGHPLISTG